MGNNKQLCLLSEKQNQKKTNIFHIFNSHHFGELLRDFGGIGACRGAFSQRHHHKDLEELLLLQLDQVLLQRAVARAPF